MRKPMKRFKKRYAVAQRQHVRILKRVSHHPAFTIPALTFGFLILLTVAIMAIMSGGTPKLVRTDSHIVIIAHDNVTETVPTRADTVAAVLRRFNIPVNAGDVVEPAENTQIVTDNFHINVYRAVPVTIVDGGSQTFTYTAALTPRSIVSQAGIHLYPEDDVSYAPTDNFVTEGSVAQRVIINRATPVNVNIYGTPVVIRTHATTVGSMLTSRGLLLQPSDVVEPSINAPITPNMQIFVLHKGQQVVTQESSIPAPTQIIEDDSLSFGTTAVRQQGSAGQMLTTFLVQTNADGTQSEKQIQQIVTVQPVPEIIAQGKAVQIPSDKEAVMAAAGISPSDYPYVDYIVSHESGWCPTKLQGEAGYCPPYAPASIPDYLGYGLGQATPGYKMSSFGSDWETNAITQLKWATSYADGRYGSWSAAYNHWSEYSNW